MVDGGQRVRLLNGNKFPLISIITVVRNCEEILEDTILSVVNQSYDNFEYIIIDGNSTDNTLKVIRKYEEQIAYWISEPDTGIYDAMNKGIALANGAWINFMNAGDRFYTDDVSRIFSDVLLSNNFDIVYGDVVAQNLSYDSEIIVKAKTKNDIWKGMIFSHQSCFIKSDIAKHYLFNLKYKLAADYEQILRLFIDGYKFCYLPTIVSKVRIGGLSYSNNRTIIEQIQIVHSQKPFSFKLIYFFTLYLINIFSSLIGKKMTNHLRRLKWRYYHRQMN